MNRVKFQTYKSTYSVMKLHKLWILKQLRY